MPKPLEIRDFNGQMDVEEWNKWNRANPFRNIPSPGASKDRELLERILEKLEHLESKIDAITSGKIYMQNSEGIFVEVVPTLLKK
jgi:hypothetical protein